MKNTTIIFLCGMPGSGKSTIGLLLAKKLNYVFVDLDSEIEKHENNTISNIFTNKGEVYFRDVEHTVLKNLIQNVNPNTVVATGGGTPAFHNNLHLILSSGLVFYLQTPIALLTERLAPQNNRPLLQHQNLNERLNALLQAREPNYAQADYTVLNNGSAAETVNAILNKLQPF